MQKFEEGDKVKIIEMPPNENHLINQTGIVMKPGGIGHESDDVIIRLNDGNMIYVKEHQLIKV